MIENKPYHLFATFLLRFLNGSKSGGTSVAKLPEFGNSSSILVQYVPLDIGAKGLTSFNKLKVMHLSVTRITSCSPDLNKLCKIKPFLADL